MAHANRRIYFIYKTTDIVVFQMYVFLFWWIINIFIMYVDRIEALSLRETNSQTYYMIYLRTFMILFCNTSYQLAVLVRFLSIYYYYITMYYSREYLFIVYLVK